MEKTFTLKGWKAFVFVVLPWGVGLVTILRAVF